MKNLLLIILAFYSLSYCNDKGLLEYEKNSIDVFKKASQSVVFIKCTDNKYNYLTLNHLNVPKGAGSGCIWDKNGHIVTNYHVIKNAQKVFVHFDKDTSFEAKIIGTEPSKDLAVIKIDPSGLNIKPIEIDSNTVLEVGRKALAIGNPFGLDKTLTVGIISATGRQIHTYENRTIKNIIQTDADINPGNSGGPLLNSQGKMIGVNTAIFTTSGSSAGIGFAIPSQTVLRVVKDIIQYGKVKRAGLGIMTLNDQNNLIKNTKGVAILTVPNGSNAEKAGLKGITKDGSKKNALGDVILKIDNYTISDNDDLSHALEHYSAFEKIRITILRDGKEVIVPFSLIEINN